MTIGELISETDARGVTVLRIVDALDRVTFVDYPDDKLDITYTFDDPTVPFSKGRLTSIARNGSSVDYRYDRFGRILQDGTLTYAYDRNGNRVEIGYPKGVSAHYTFDYADRETSLSVARGTDPARVIASDATYKPLGPLAGLTLGNGMQEVRDYDQRYFPSSIQVPGHLHWVYTTDKVGNILQIRDQLDPASTRDYGYQDHQYYLTRGDGPWGDLSWTYDRLGNRLSETRDNVRTDYTYTPNAAGKSSAKLASTRPNAVGAETTAYAFDAAGNQIHQTTRSSKVVYTYDDAKRLAEIRSRDADRLQATAIEYDGRSFLKRAVLSLIGDRPFESWVTTATYSSEGVLHHKTYDERPTPWSMRGTPRVSGDDYVFYFAGRPVAQLGVEVTSGVEASTWLFLTTDHLGTPLLASGQDGVAWSGGFEPFGWDYSEASDGGVFLRLPGQWDDESLSKRGDYYNVHRWYQTSAGRYHRPDPLGVLGSRFSEYNYAEANPLLYKDPLGLKTCIAFSLSTLTSVGQYSLALVDHVGLFFDGTCKGKCDGIPPTLYDPSGSYRPSDLGSGRLEELSRIGVDSFDEYLNYQCTSNQAHVEVLCFETSCCEEQEILDNARALGGGEFQCGTNVSSSVSGVGPFADIPPTFWPASLRRQISKIFLSYNRPARYQRKSCN